MKGAVLSQPCGLWPVLTRHTGSMPMPMLALLAAVVSAPAPNLTAGRNRPAILRDERFGDVLRPRMFLRPALTQFNHGSFGTVPRDVMQELHRLQEQCEDDPDVRASHLSFRDPSFPSSRPLVPLDAP